MNPGEWTILGLCGFLFLWYLGWNIFNRRRGIAAYYWLRRFLCEIGEISQAGWLGSSSSGARLGVEHGKRPFRKVEATIWLESRELLPLWIYHAIRGQKEVVQILASLQFAPKLPFEVGKIGDKGFDRVVQQKGLIIGDKLLMEEFRIACPTNESLPDTMALSTFLEANRGVIERVGLRRESPHLLLHARIKPLLAMPPESFFESLQIWLTSHQN